MTNISFLFTALMLMTSFSPAEKANNHTVAPIKMAIAGLTHTHVHWILGREDRGDVRIVGISEPNRDLAERYSKQHGYSMDLVFDDLEEMLEKTKPDAVLAFNSIYEHLEVVEKCAPRGIHVMVEKPLAVSLDHAKKMAALARKHKIHLLTNYETTWYPSHYEMYRMIHEQKAVGNIRKMVIHDGHPGPIEIGCNKEFLDWLTDPKWNGAGALTDFGCYGANLMTWFMQGQRPTSVFAITQQIKPELYPKVDDEATIIVTYPKAQGIIQASWNWPVSRKDTHVYGKTGYLYADNRTDLRICLGEGKPETQKELPSLKAPYDDPFAYLAGVLRGEIKVGPTDLSSLENNMVVMEILEAAKVSAKEGRKVDLAKGKR